MKNVRKIFTYIPLSDLEFPAIECVYMEYFVKAGGKSLLLVHGGY